MTIADHEYCRQVSYGLSIRESRPRLLQVYACMAALAVVIGATLGFLI